MASSRVLGKPARHEWAALGETDVYVHMWGPGDRVRLNQLPDETGNRIFEFNNKWYSAAAKAGLRGARMEIGRIYPSSGRAYGVRESKWQQDVIQGTLVDPNFLAKAAAPLVRALSRGTKLRIHDDKGTDLTLGLAHRKVQVSRGSDQPCRPKAAIQRARHPPLRGCSRRSR